MRSTNFLTMGLTLGLLLFAGGAGAQTFEATSLVPELGIERLDRSETRAHFGRSLMGDTWATVVIGNVDVYDRFPYLEARWFQVVSDPAWDRLVFGETERGLSAYDGVGSAFGALSSPRGMATDEFGNLYVADSGNDRVLVFAAHGEFSELELRPRYAVEGLERPHDVAFSDGGTPFEAHDDRLYVAVTGANAVARVQLDDDGATVTHRLGALGGGVGRFAGPVAVAVGREAGRNTDLIYVADAHGGRIVRLHDTGSELEWVDALDHTLGAVRDLDTDHWGQVYAASPEAGVVQKFSRELAPLAELDQGLVSPRAFHVPMVNVVDHVRGTRERQGHGGALVLERWSDESGVRRVKLGVELRDVAVVDDGRAHFVLTDRARVRTALYQDGRRVATHDLGWMDGGSADVGLDQWVAGQPAGDYRLEIQATSSYDEDRTASSSVDFAHDGASPALPRVATVLGATPNPFNPTTRIEYVVPTGGAIDVRVEIVDLRGRVVRHLLDGQAEPGRHGVIWQGRDDRGRSVSSGVYLYRVRLGDAMHSGKLALVK